MTVELHAWPTPNGYKISIMLEEIGMPYTVVPVDIGAGDQFKPEFLKLSPNNRMPALVDPDGPEGKPIGLFESGAILIYLAEKTGRLLPADPHGRYTAIQWLMWQMGGLGPMLGQAHHFRSYAPEPIQYAIDRYTNEAKRLYGVLDRRLGEAEFLAGEYSIADIACWPWTRSHDRQGIDFADYPNVRRWYEAIEARPATQRGLELLKDKVRTGPISKEAREVMFGSTQYQRR